MVLSVPRGLCGVLSGFVVPLRAAFCCVCQVATEVPVICLNLDRFVSATLTVALVCETEKKDRSYFVRLCLEPIAAPGRRDLSGEWVSTTAQPHLQVLPQPLAEERQVRDVALRDPALK